MAGRDILADLHVMFADVLRRVRHATMLPDEALAFTWQSAISLIHAGVPGVFVECGTWLGGCSFGLALAQQQIFGKVVRPVLMFDSFEGLPPAGMQDGPAAHEYQRRVDDPGYYNNCRVAIGDVRRIRDSLGLDDAACRLIPGWFESTVPEMAPAIATEGAALLRVDCDWYDPVRLVLDHLEPLVHPEGIVIVDDYYAWDGAARSVHDYLSQNNLAYRLRQIGPEPTPVGAWFVKRQVRAFGGPV
jgi:O-methyltransferase